MHIELSPESLLEETLTSEIAEHAAKTESPKSGFFRYKCRPANRVKSTSGAVAVLNHAA
jgi:hypothetical protein